LRPASRAEARARRCVVPAGERAAEPDDHVEEEVTEGADDHAYNRLMDTDEGRSRLRTFLLGGLFGASAVLAAVRRRSGPQLVRPSGLAAFEDAPCYREAVERDARKARTGR
jgi:hypothetical protein